MAKALTDKEYTVGALLNEFEKIYGNSNDVRVFCAPARINIIGEHIDYNGGNVLPICINRYLYIAVRKRNDTKIIYNDVRFPGTYEFDINDNFVYKKENDYANYLNGILSQLKEQEKVFPCGFEILMVSNIPAGGGVSSSSALECGFAFAISEVFGFELGLDEIAKLGQMSEHKFMNVMCGIMDQFIISTGQRHYAEYLSCREKCEVSFVPLDIGDYRFVVMNTNKVRRLADSKYNERRHECEEALNMARKWNPKLNYLCSIIFTQVEECKPYITDPVLFKRLEHCVMENYRVFKSVLALQGKRVEELGQLLIKSHISLRDNYEVTGIELDTLAENAWKQEGCVGARMTGAGFGGCAIALVHEDYIPAFTENMQRIYREKIGYEAGFFACSSADGVREIDLSKVVR